MNVKNNQANNQSQAKKGAKIVSRLLTVTIIITVVTAILMFLGLTYVITVVVLGLMPAIVATVVDRRRRKLASKTIMSLNFAGLIPYIVSIAKAGDPNQAAKYMLADPYMWLMVYGFAGFGWLVIHVIPQVVLLFLLVKADFTIKNLHQMQKKLVEEWGEGVKGDTNIR